MTFSLGQIGCMVQEMYCAKQCDRLVTPECVKKRTFTVGYDNGRTPGSVANDCGEPPNLIRFNQSFEVLGWMVNGVEIGQGETIGPYAGWSQQLQGWATFFNTIDPNPNSTADFGVNPAPTWRFTEITGCDPTAVYGPLRLKREDGCLFTVYPVPSISSDSTEFLSHYLSVDCEGEKEKIWCDAEGNEADAPEEIDCFVPCSFQYGPYIDVGDAPECTEIVKDLCDDTGEALVPFVLVITTCDGKRTRERWTTDSYANAESPDDLVVYEVQGTVVDCASGETYVEPPAPCEDFEIVKLFSMSGLTGALRNREWELGPRTAATINTEQGRAVRESFNFTAPTTVDANFGGLSVNDTNNAADIQDAQVVEGYILVDSHIKLRWTGGSAGYLAVELGECCGDYSLVLEGALPDGNVNPTPAIDIPKGVHAIRIWNIDDFSNTSRSAQYSLDGGATWTTDATPPGIQLSRTKPEETCKQVKVCKPSGTVVGLMDDMEIDLESCYECSKLCASSPSVWSGC